MRAWAFTLLSVLVVSAVSLVGGATLALAPGRLRGISLALVGVAVGALLGDVVFHLLPESYVRLQRSGATAPLVLAGFLLFFSLEKLLRWRRAALAPAPGGRARALSPLVAINLIGDGLHNLVDGMLIAASFAASTSLGVTTTVAVLLHEVPQELGDLGVLVHGGLTVRRALLWNLLSALTAAAGAVAVLAAGRAVAGLPDLLLPVTAGGFLYIAGAELVPELQRPRATLFGALGQLGLIGAGAAAMAALARR